MDRIVGESQPVPFGSWNGRWARAHLGVRERGADLAARGAGAVHGAVETGGIEHVHVVHAVAPGSAGLALFLVEGQVHAEQLPPQGGVAVAIAGSADGLRRGPIRERHRHLEQQVLEAVAGGQELEAHAVERRLHAGVAQEHALPVGVEAAAYVLRRVELRHQHARQRLRQDHS